MPEDSNPLTNTPSDKISDVQDPGTTTPDATARPILGITSPQQPDPMLSNSTVTSDASLANLSTPGLPPTSTPAPVDQPSGPVSPSSPVSSKPNIETETDLSGISPTSSSDAASTSTMPSQAAGSSPGMTLSPIGNNITSPDPVVSPTSSDDLSSSAKPAVPKKKMQMIFYVAIAVVVIIALIVIISIA